MHTPADTGPQPLDIPALRRRLTALIKRHQASGRISHALGVRSALTALDNELARRRGLALAQVVTAAAV